MVLWLFTAKKNHNIDNLSKREYNENIVLDGVVAQKNMVF